MKKKKKKKRNWRDVSGSIYFSNKRKEWTKYLRREKKRLENLKFISSTSDKNKYSSLIKEMEEMMSIYNSSSIAGVNPNEELYEKYDKLLDEFFESDRYKEYEEERKKYEFKDYGPGVKITSKKDFLNKRLKLPIYDRSFQKVCHNRNFGRFSEKCLGKTFIPDPAFRDPSGIVIGYEYYWDDDYALILLDNGKVDMQLLNSHWKVV